MNFKISLPKWILPEHAKAALVNSPAAPLLVCLGRASRISEALSQKIDVQETAL